MMLFDCTGILSITVGIMLQGGGPEEKHTSLCSDKVVGGKRWHSRELKPKESKGEEGHIALGVEGQLALG
jgi:hypothetical protein